MGGAWERQMYAKFQSEDLEKNTSIDRPRCTDIWKDIKEKRGWREDVRWIHLDQTGSNGGQRSS